MVSTSTCLGIINGEAFLQNLKFIVIDEAHVYRGVFGSNVAMLLRRLMRICSYYHADPQIILSSATIANPEEHAKRLTGKDFEIISKDGAPRGKKSFVFWNPPFIDDRQHNSPINPPRNQRSPNTKHHKKPANSLLYHIQTDG